ncbi:MAG TPA: Gfo/Idh/MocA family oxidoreductase, partial [Saprospiraceae bacterium]|nr:Gfo/Idh/MocA family oxidoreductase [Saprospiraceae bacterium]
HIPHAYGAYEELLANSSIQAVYISLPNHLHYDWILKALQSGKHVLCEKPMCLSMTQLEEVEQASLESGLKVMEGFMHLYHPQTRLWKSILESGVLGEIQYIRSNFAFTLERPSDNYRWDSDAGGGALLDVGVYPISLFQFLLDENPESGMASMAMQGGIDMSTGAMLQFSHGRSGHFFVSFKSDFSTDTCVHGSLGQLHVTHPYTNVDACQAYIQSGNKTDHIEVPREYLYAGEIENMHDMILSGKPSQIPFSFSKNVLRTILMLQHDVKSFPPK